MNTDRGQSLSGQFTGFDRSTITWKLFIQRVTYSIPGALNHEHVEEISRVAPTRGEAYSSGRMVGNQCNSHFLKSRNRKVQFLCSILELFLLFIVYLSFTKV